jgi:hypothetical protein
MHRARTAWPAALASLVLAAVVALGGPANPATASGSGSQPGAEGEPTADQVQAAHQRALTLHQAVTGDAATLAQAEQALRAAAADAALALESYAQAAAVRDAAVRELDRQQQALADSEQQVASRRADLAHWVWAAYAGGGSLDDSPTVHTLLAGGSTDDLASTQALLGQVLRSRARTAADLEAALVAQQDVVDQVRRTADQAAASAAAADAARAAGEAAVAAERSRLTALSQRMAGDADAARRADQDAATLDQAWSLAAGSTAGTGSGASTGGGGSGVGRPITGPVGDCRGEDTSRYPNGEIPASALCPVWGATGDLLRPDAALAFNRMSQGYAQKFGTAICVTDTYRSYAEQVRVKAERGGWAATPGHSNHGWGTAADLCGGIQSFGTVTHRWMEVNAPLYGWFHPSWAEPAGSLPEAWHWEFAG